ncbi:OmpA/MotB [Nocardioidaceae bacterium Broad-1]|uniref:hypothetical protein n=1 Tax=Nocardioides luteus TaxID=1844 RepID=UPI00020287B6|nr:hypothetical protein [Nocardioides luteus]EGD41149.1 OmpA/MotB [Nocardioidaceae bacterium Broad-1]MBG6098563.1 hypothetical protein [Nocardioides luteus]
MHPTRLLPLAVAATALLVSSCGSPDEATDPGSSPTPSASSPGTPKSQPEPSRPPSSEKPVRGLVSAGGAAEGDLEKTATPLPDAAAIQAYAAGLGTSLQDSFTTEATRLLAHVPSGQRLYAQTVYDGCEAPDPATITASTSGADVVLHVTPPKSTKIQCLVAERSVALLSTDIPVG